MKLEEVNLQPCSIARALSVIGDGWSLMLVRDALYGRRRFSDFVEYSGAQPTVVSDRLKRLVEAGIFDRVEYQQHPMRHEYRLSAKGRDLAGVMLAFMRWGDEWLDQGDGPPVTVTHTACGGHADPRVVCGTCAADLELSSIEATAGPGFPDDGPRVFDPSVRRPSQVETRS